MPMYNMGTFRDNYIAAPLKHALRVFIRMSLPIFPRQLYRGPIEAVSTTASGTYNNAIFPRQLYRGPIEAGFGSCR